MTVNFAKLPELLLNAERFGGYSKTVNLQPIGNPNRLVWYATKERKVTKGGYDGRWCASLRP
jgi:hypothetical protein